MTNIPNEELWKQNTVLLVDDEPLLLKALERLLLRRHFCVATAASGEEALRYCQKDLPKVIIADYNMGDTCMTGIELLTQVTQHYRGVVTILLSGQIATPDMIDIMQKMNLYAFLDKPCERDVFLKTVTRALKVVR